MNIYMIEMNSLINQLIQPFKFTNWAISLNDALEIEVLGDLTFPTTSPVLKQHFDDDNKLIYTTLTIE